MEKDFGSWAQQQCPPHQAPNLKCTSFTPDLAWRNASPDCANPNGFVSNETVPGHTGYKSLQLKTGQPQGWFYGLPRYRQALTPTPGNAPKRDTPENVAPRPVEKTEKKFLVFDHSGNQTRLIYSPSAATHLNQNSIVANPSIAEKNHGSRIEEWITKTGLLFEAGLPQNQDTGEGEEEEESEMHEDTEELNALLYSDEDDECEGDSVCDEEVSTGHSPNKTSYQLKQEEEEVGSSSNGGYFKRKRLLDLEEECNSSSLMDTASSGNNDAESSCGESGNKRMKREKIRETVNILQNIIPGGKGKDAMYVLDEAIQYLRSLKLKAKSLGETLE